MDKTGFLARVEALHADGWRLAIINATTVINDPEAEAGAFDVSWSFAKDNLVEHLRHRILPGEEVPSISPSFGAAFLYENEMRELFGINMTGINVDLQGQLYKTATRVPFAPSAIRARLAAQGKQA
jgi:Ni,Fe-hydrogenase III component G